MEYVSCRGVYHPDEERVEGSVLELADGRVRAVREDVPDGADPVVDVDAYALPGLVDAHTHAPIRPWEGDQSGQMRAPAAEQAARAVANLGRDLAAGTTTARLMGCEDRLDVHLRAAARAGEFDAPRLHVCGGHLTPTAGHGGAGTTTDGEAAIRERIRGNVAAGADHVKYFATGGVSSTSGGLDRAPYSRAEVDAIVDEAHRQGLPVAAHAHGGPGARDAVEAGVDTIEHAALLERDLVETLAADGRHVVGTFSLLFDEDGIEAGDADSAAVMAKLREARAAVRDVWADVLDTDVPVALGTDSMHGRLPREVTHLVELGATPERALRAVTSEAARALGADDVGHLREGARADVVLVAADPREEPGTLADPVAVVRDGEVVA